MGESPKSPEAKVGMRVEDLWDCQEAQLSPTEKLNACFEGIPVSAFPFPPSNQGTLLCVRETCDLKKVILIIPE